MYRIIKLFCLSCLTLLLVCENSQGAWPWSKDQKLVAINGSSYTAEDYMHWWENWPEKDNNASHDIQAFIEWKLLVQEALSMELDQDPGLQRENEVYLKVRRRMLFKNETVDSKIQITEQDLKDRFLVDYSPVSFLTALYFKSEEKAQEAHNSLLNKTISLAELQKLPEADGGPSMSRQRQYVPMQVENNQELRKMIGETSVGDISAVFPSGHFFALAHLDKQEVADVNSYTNYSKHMRSRIYKEESIKLTSELIKSLWQKYEVQVNEDLLALVNANMTGEVLNQPIFTTNRANIPVALLVKDIRKEHKMRKLEKWTDEQRGSLYRGLLNGMIIEYLISWESMERHYEDIPPFKWRYEYYKEGSLVKQLEILLIEPNVSLSESEINSFYRENEDDFRDSDVVTLAMVDDDKKLVEKIWQEINQGNEFLEVTKSYYAAPVPVKDIEADKLIPEVAAVLKKTKIGDVAPPFSVQEDRLILVKLLGRKRSEPKPFLSVKQDIIKKLKPLKFNQLREEYIAKVVAYSEIEINQKAWDKLVAEQTH